MSIKGKRVIFVGPADNANHKPLNVEGAAITSILPGSVLVNTTTGLNFNANAATVFGDQLLVADKDQQRTRSVDDAWTAGENMVAIAPRSGEFINILVESGNNILRRGTALSRGASGTLKIAATDGSEDILAFADEVINVTADALVCCRIA